MEDRVNIYEEKGVLRVEASGAYEAFKAREFFEQILEEARAKHLDKVLIDARSFPGELSVIERYDIGMLLAELSTTGIRLAFVVRPSLVWPDRFGENVAANRSVCIRVTTDLPQALEWLHQVPANQATDSDKE